MRITFDNENSLCRRIVVVKKNNVLDASSFVDATIDGLAELGFTEEQIFSCLVQKCESLGLIEEIDEGM